MRKIRLPRPASCNFDERKADKAVQFFSRYLTHRKARWVGQPFVPCPFQEVDIREIFGRVDADGNRVIRQVYKEIPKKNGKSEEAAGIALKLVFADGEYGAEVYSAAADRNQAAIVFDVAASMVRASSALSKRSKVRNSVKRIIHPAQESYYRVLSADVAGKHGYNSHGVIFDELHTQRDMRLWEVLTFGAGLARSQPLTYGITTAGVPGESPVAEMLHEEADQILRGITPCPADLYPVIYGAADDDPWDNEEVWRACNPAIGHFLDIKDLRVECEKAKRRPSEQNSFRRLHLNQWVAQETRWIDMNLWDDPVCSAPFDWRELRERPCTIGVDLSSKLDLTSVCVVWIDDNARFYFWPFFWIPRDNLSDRPNVESAKYLEWIERGHLEATPGAAVSFDRIRNHIRQFLDQECGLRIGQIALDPMFAEQLRQQLEADGYEVMEFRQRTSHFTEPCQELEGALSDLRVRHGGHPVLRWNADCVTVRQDINGGIRPVKPDRLKSRKRIDGIVAALMGLGRAILTAESEPSPWDNKETAVM